MPFHESMHGDSTPLFSCSSSSSSSPLASPVLHQLFRYRLGEELLRLHSPAPLFSSAESFNSTLTTALWGCDADFYYNHTESEAEEYVNSKSTAAAETESSSVSCYPSSENRYKKEKRLMHKIKSETPCYRFPPMEDSDWSDVASAADDVGNILMAKCRSIDVNGRALQNGARRSRRSGKNTRKGRQRCSPPQLVLRHLSALSSTSNTIAMFSTTMSHLYRNTGESFYQAAKLAMFNKEMIDKKPVEQKIRI